MNVQLITLQIFQRLLSKALFAKLSLVPFSADADEDSNNKKTNTSLWTISPSDLNLAFEKRTNGRCNCDDDKSLVNASVGSSNLMQNMCEKCGTLKFASQSEPGVKTSKKNYLLKRNVVARNIALQSKMAEIEKKRDLFSILYDSVSYRQNS